MTHILMRRATIGRSLAMASITSVASGLVAIPAHAAPPSTINLCNGLGVSLPAALGLSGTLTQVPLGALDPTSQTFVGVPASACNLAANTLSANGLTSTNGTGITLGGGQLTGLGGTGNPVASAGDPTAMALGNGALTATGAANAVALGTNAAVNTANSVALGAGSTALRGAVPSYSALGLTTPQTSAGEVSVGAAGAVRQLTNLAAGSSPTDAVNLGQLSGATAQLGAATAAGLGGGSVYNPLLGTVTLPNFTIRGTTYANVGAALDALDVAIGTGGPSAPFVGNNSDNAAAPVATGRNATAGGYGASATGVNSVALGTGSVDGGQSNVVSVGKAGSERRIINVAPGTIAAGSTDAVNGGQLSVTNTQVASLQRGAVQYDRAANGTTLSSVTLGSDAGGPVGIHNLAAGTGATDAATVGQVRLASTALGTSTAATLGGGSAYNAALGTVSLPGFNIRGTTYDSVGAAFQAVDGALAGGGGGGAAAAPFVGNNAAGAAAPVATGLNSTAGGYGATATGANSVALGAGSSDGGQNNVVSIGAVGAERRLINVAPGQVAAGSTEAVNGGQLFTTNTQVASLQRGAVQYDRAADGSTQSSVTLASDAGGPVVIHNLAAGVAASDAATVGQVQNVAQSSVQYATVNGAKSNTVALQGGSPGGVTISNLAPGQQGTDAVNLNQLRSYSGNMMGQSQAYTDTRISNLAALTGRQIASARRDAAGGTALALAATGIRFDDRPGKFSVGGATSYYNGQVGLAFGVAGTSETGRVRVNAAVSASPTMDHPDVGGVVGASIAIN